MFGTSFFLGLGFVWLFNLSWWAFSLSRRLKFLQSQSRHCGETGLGTWAYLRYERWPRLCRQATPIFVAYYDLDGFREINNLHGHGYADHIIREAAAALLCFHRRGTDECFRAYAQGDEMIVVGSLSADADPSTFGALIRDRIAKRGISVSVGVAIDTCVRYRPQRQELLAMAEAELRRAKLAGGGRSSVAMLPPSAEECTGDLVTGAFSAGMARP